MRPRVATGLERLADEGPRVAGLARGARVGLVVHAASIDADGRHALERLTGARELEVVRLFAPEHGLWGHEQDMEEVAGAVEPRSGLPVISLYGDSADSLRPPPGSLDGLDAVICDLQDVGSRYYTFVYTISYVMEEAARARVPVVVLDRPNPIGGIVLEGPILEPELASFVGRYPLPVRHGLTAGELARFFAGACGVAGELRVVEMRGWSREMSFEATGLPWVPPSPNMPALATALVYPGACLAEGTNLSEGRGTTTPFELVGAPWLDPHALASALRERVPEGAAYRAASFRPMFQKHAGRGCAGVQVIVRDPRIFRSFRAYLTLLLEARRQNPERFAWRTEPYEFERERLAIDLLLGRRDLRPALEADLPVPEIESSWAAELAGFAERRREFLAYR